MKVEITFKNGFDENVTKETLIGDHIEFCKYEEIMCVKVNGFHHVTYLTEAVVEIKVLEI